MKNIEAVIFDLDDTLLDRTKTFLIYCEYLAEKYIMAEQRCKFVGYLVEQGNGGYRDSSIFYPNAVSHWNLPFSPNEMKNVWLDIICRLPVAEKGLLQALDYLSTKYRLGMITNGSSGTQNAKIDALNIRRYFQSIIISGEVDCKKPDEKIFMLSCRELNINPNCAVYIGDNYENDYLGAQQAGLRAVLKRKEDNMISIIGEL